MDRPSSSASRTRRAATLYSPSSWEAWGRIRWRMRSGRAYRPSGTGAAGTASRRVNADVAAVVSRAGSPLAVPDKPTLYGGDHRGYTDYPFPRARGVTADKPELLIVRWARRY